MSASSHSIALTDDWALWRCVCLRGAGFPASLAMQLAAPDVVAATDRLFSAEQQVATTKKCALDALDRERAACSSETEPLIIKAAKAVRRDKLAADVATGTPADADVVKWREAIASSQAAARDVETAFAAARRRLTRTLHDGAANAKLREAVTWQNRAAVESGLSALLRADPTAPPTSADRKKEELVANYLYRYATKNDTIGFFGPVGWARFEESAERISVHPGKDLITRRRTYFEQWAIDALAERLSKDESVRVWLAPRRFGFVRVEGTTAHSPLTGRLLLTPVQAAVLRACDGETVARDLAASLVTSFPGELRDAQAVYAVLNDFVAKKLVAWDLEFRTTWQPELELRRRIERIADERARATCLAALSELEAARDEVAGSGGDAKRLASALGAIEETFTRLTNTDATRNAGAMYASRCVVFEDCQRGLDLTLGSKLLEEIGPALSLVLTSARYVTHEAAKAYDAAFRELYATLVKKRGTTVVPFAEFWYAAERLFHGAKSKPIDAVARAVEEKWGRIFGLTGDSQRAQYRSEDLRAAVGEAFPAPRAGWTGARYHSPDLMIAARSVDAISRGEYLAVLGEVHAASNTLDFACLMGQHPDPEALGRAVASDIPEPRVLPVIPKSGIRMGNVRGTRALFTPHDYELEKGFERSDLPRDRVLVLSEMQLEDDGERLVVTTHDGRFRLDLLEIVGSTLGDVVMNKVSLLPDMPHSPRVTIDKVVVRRETWRCTPADLSFADETSEAARFVAARRWARTLGLPRFIYAGSSLEVKPVFVDLDSPIAVNMLAKLARRGNKHVTGGVTIKISEMLPTLDDTWLPDADGNRYTAELRVIALDQRTTR